MKFLALDFEADSLDAKTTNAIDVGAILFNESFEVEATLSQLMYDESDPPLSEEIVEITHITQEMLKNEGKPRRDVFSDKILPMVGEADVVFCHNVGYDKTILDSTCDRFGLFLRSKEFICTLSNFNWPKKYRCHKLGHLGYEHGLDFPASSLHRALPDCELLVELLKQYDLNKTLEYARIPWVFVKGDIIAPFNDLLEPKMTEVAKSLGFSWEKIRFGYDQAEFSKTWCKRIKADQFDALKKAAETSARPFRVSPII